SIRLPSQVPTRGAVGGSMWGARALAQLETQHSRRRFHEVAGLALWLFCACGRLGYDETDTFDAAASTDARVGDVAVRDVAVPPGSDASEDRPGAAGSGGGADVPDVFEETAESGDTFLDGPSTPDQGGW